MASELNEPQPCNHVIISYFYAIILISCNIQAWHLDRVRIRPRPGRGVGGSRRPATIAIGVASAAVLPTMASHVGIAVTSLNPAPTSVNCDAEELLRAIDNPSTGVATPRESKVHIPCRLPW